MYRLIEKLHLERYLNTRLILAIDLAVSGLASLCALVSVKLLLHLNISDYTLLWLCCSVVYSFVTFYLLKTYHSVIRHSTLREIAKFVVAVIGKELLLGLTILLYPPTPLFGMHMLALLLFDLLLTLCGLILIRVAMIIVYDLVKNNEIPQTAPVGVGLRIKRKIGIAGHPLAKFSALQGRRVPEFRPENEKPHHRGVSGLLIRK